MKLLGVSVLLFAFSFFLLSFASAAQGPPTPICEVQAVIVDLGFTDNADIHIIRVGRMIQKGDKFIYSGFSCKDYKNSVLKKVSLQTKAEFKVGQTIEGELSYFIDDFFPRGSYLMENIKIISEPEVNVSPVMEQRKLVLLSFMVPIIIIISFFLLYYLMKPR